MDLSSYVLVGSTIVLIISIIAFTMGSGALSTIGEAFLILSSIVLGVDLAYIIFIKGEEEYDHV